MGGLYVIKPQGIVVGPSGMVTTGGRFVASTVDVCNDAFMQSSGALTLSGDSDASVINLGRISSSGGDVFLIARSAVINTGTVSAPNGDGGTGRRRAGVVAYKAAESPAIAKAGQRHRFCAPAGVRVPSAHVERIHPGSVRRPSSVVRCTRNATTQNAIDEILGRSRQLQARWCQQK